MDNNKFNQAISHFNHAMNQAVEDIGAALDAFSRSIPEETLKRFSYTDPEAPLTRDEAFKNVCKKNRRFK